MGEDSERRNTSLFFTPDGLSGLCFGVTLPPVISPVITLTNGNPCLFYISITGCLYLYKETTANVWKRLALHSFRGAHSQLGSSCMTVRDVPVLSCGFIAGFDLYSQPLFFAKHFLMLVYSDSEINPSFTRLHRPCHSMRAYPHFTSFSHISQKARFKGSQRPVTFDWHYLRCFIQMSNRLRRIKVIN